MTRPQYDHADLGLGYPPHDDTPEMRQEPVHSAKNATDSYAINHLEGAESYA